MTNNKRSYTRPGVEGAARLVDLAATDLDHARVVWKDVESKYPDMLLEKGGKKLKQLDEFCQSLGERLRKEIDDIDNGTNSNDNDCSISQKELLKVVEWKFAKGKPRYALMKHLNANTKEAIQNCSSRAFSSVSNTNSDNHDTIIKESIDGLCELKGVGPATASAILCLVRPDLFSFMDDEVIECLYEGKRGYTFPIYRNVNQRCKQLANSLSNGEQWTPWRVGRALWTASKLHASNDPHFMDTVFNNQDDKIIQPKTTKKASKIREKHQSPENKECTSKKRRKRS